MPVFSLFALRLLPPVSPRGVEVPSRFRHPSLLTHFPRLPSLIIVWTHLSLARHFHPLTITRRGGSPFGFPWCHRCALRGWLHVCFTFTARCISPERRWIVKRP